MATGVTINKGSLSKGNFNSALTALWGTSPVTRVRNAKNHNTPILLAGDSLSRQTARTVTYKGSAWGDSRHPFVFSRLFCSCQSHVIPRCLREDALLADDDDVLSLTSSDPGASVLLAQSPREKEMAEAGEASELAAPARPPSAAFSELLEVMERASSRLQLPWERVRREPARSRLDDRFLSTHNPVTPASLPFLPDLHFEIERAWKNPFSARIHQHQRANFADVEGLGQHGRWLRSSGRQRHAPRRLDLASRSDPAQRQAQRDSVAARAPPPPPRSKSQRRQDARRKKQDLREVIEDRRQQRR
ncbi:hypothetical protein DPX16_1049 [Anabarilius grahami]|uniref:Uncharacterized protein n=1 Tax=Anabarilius grahami TaxID=495550 RepID=A0A3N0XSA5_ANAGA|nr:hypothetical protein DPX16_1049 [Anabarilius grahami]